MYHKLMNRKMYLKQNIRLVVEHINLSMLKVFTVVITPLDGLEIYDIYIYIYILKVIHIAFANLNLGVVECLPRKVNNFNDLFVNKIKIQHLNMI